MVPLSAYQVSIPFQVYVYSQVYVKTTHPKNFFLPKMYVCWLVTSSGKPNTLFGLNFWNYEYISRVAKHINIPSQYYQVYDKQFYENKNNFFGISLNRMILHTEMVFQGTGHTSLLATTCEFALLALTCFLLRNYPIRPQTVTNIGFIMRQR